MIQTFTQNDLVRHLYTEESTLEAGLMENLLAIDEELTENFQDYCEIKQALNNSLLDPSANSVNFILEFSRITK